MCEKQQGATLTFGTSSGTWEIVEIGSFSAPIPVLDRTHLGVTGFRQKCPGQLQDPQMFSVKVRNKGSQAYPVKGLVQLVTVTAPLGSYTTAEKVISGEGFVVDHIHPSFQSNTEELQIVEFQIQLNGGAPNGGTPLPPTRTVAA